MMYLPYKSDQRDEAIKLMADIFALVLPEEVVRRDVKLTYDAATGELVQIVMPFETKSEVTTLTVDKGWRIASGPRRSVSGVEFTMSQNSTVTCFISPGNMPLAATIGAGWGWDA
jgi:hypothetical protein